MEKVREGVVIIYNIIATTGFRYVDTVTTDYYCVRRR